MTCLIREWRRVDRKSWNNGSETTIWWPELWGARLSDTAPASEAPPKNIKDAKYCSALAAFAATADKTTATCPRCCHFYELLAGRG